MTVLAKGLLLLTSYTPLFFIFAIKSFSTNKIFSGICLALCALGLLLFVIIVVSMQKGNTVTIKIAESEIKEGDVVAYVVTYFLPFLTENFNDMSDLLAILAFYLLIAFLYINSDLIYINPLFSVGRKIFMVTTEQGNKLAILTNKKRLERFQTLRVHYFANKTIGLEVE